MHMPPLPYALAVRVPKLRMVLDPDPTYSESGRADTTGHGAGAGEGMVVVDHSRPIRIALIVTFAVVSARYWLAPLYVVLSNGAGIPYGWDAVAYTKAARTLLAGGDPWALTDTPIAFAGPPPSLLPFIPFAGLSDTVVAWAWFGLCVLSTVYIVHRLRLPWYYLMFPPLVSGVCAGSLVVPMLAVMVAGRSVVAGGAAAIRGYAVVPFLILGNWRAVAGAVTLVVVTAPFLAWPAFLAQREAVSEYLATYAWNLSATAIPVLIPVAVVALLLLGRKRFAWLAVPALWPFTQPHYAAIALPVLARSPLVALSLALPVPGLVVAGLVAQVAWERLGPRTSPT